jgi:hypothetical protein
MSIAKRSPMATILAAASKLPATGAVGAQQKRAAAAGTSRIVLADTSSSMNDLADGGRRRIDVLRDALVDVACDQLIAFSAGTDTVPGPSHLPEPMGNTALHLALDEASRFRPAMTLVVSDGEPDNEELAFTAARRLPGRIDVIFCGPERNVRARAFLMRLAAVGGGVFVHCDISANALRLAPVIRGLLGPGAKR